MFECKRYKNGTFCGGKDIYLKFVYPHLGVFCKKCKRLIKWIPKKEEELAKIQIELFSKKGEK